MINLILKTNFKFCAFSASFLIYKNKKIRNLINLKKKKDLKQIIKIKKIK